MGRPEALCCCTAAVLVEHAAWLVLAGEQCGASSVGLLQGLAPLVRLLQEALAFAARSRMLLLPQLLVLLALMAATPTGCSTALWPFSLPVLLVLNGWCPDALAGITRDVLCCLPSGGLNTLLLRRDSLTEKVLVRGPPKASAGGKERLQTKGMLSGGLGSTTLTTAVKLPHLCSGCTP